jgi:hypothetical protein
MVIKKLAAPPLDTEQTKNQLIEVRRMNDE